MSAAPVWSALNVGGAVLNVVSRAGPPGRPPLVLVHSLGTDHRIWEPVADRLARRAPVISFDLRGHGLSDADPAARLDAHAGDVIALLDDAGAGRGVVCGLSIGGQVAMAAALAAPDRIAGLAVMGSGARIGDAARYAERARRVREGGIDAIAAEQVDRWFSARSRAAMPDRVRLVATMLRRQPVEGYLAGVAALAEADLGDRPARIACPTLCLVGAEDVSTPPEAMRALAETIPGAELVVVDGAGHLPPLEAPEAVAAALGRLLDRVG